MIPPFLRRLALALLLSLALVAGAAADPFEVATYADLCKVGTGTDGWTLDADYIQTADIQCPAGENFTPIGSLTVWFSGSYNGQGYKIRDLYMYYPKSDNIGMFRGTTYGAVTKNIVLDNVSVTAGRYSGCLFGEADGTWVENCSVSGSIDCIYDYDPRNFHRANLGLLTGVAYDSEILNCSANGEIRGSEALYVMYSGGLAGYVDGCNISSCTTTGVVLYSRSFVGGLVGSSYGTSISSCSADVEIRGYSDANLKFGMWGVGGLVGEAYDTTISACSASGDIIYADSACGGLIGEAVDVTLTGCRATGDVRINEDYWNAHPNGGFGGTVTRCIIDTCSAEGTVFGGVGGVGGFIGVCDQTSVTKCYATGSVDGIEFVGGLIGDYNPGTTGMIEDSYATGSVVCRGTESYCTAGGLIGLWDQYDLVLDGHIKNVYSAGSVSAPNLPAEAVGGLIGQIYSGTGVVATAAYWDTETSGQAASAGGAVGKTTAEMKTIATFAGWNIATPAEYTDEVWYIVPGEDYPRLAWQGLPTLPPVAEFYASPTSGTAPLAVQFTDASTNAPTAWSWTFGDGGTSDQQHPSHTYNEPGTYTVALTATNAGGSDTETKTGHITVTAPILPPVAAFSAAPTTGTAPLTVQFTDESTGATLWSWNFGDGRTSIAQSPSHTYSTAGTYTVALTVTNAGGSDTETKNGYITVSAAPTPTASSPSSSSSAHPLPYSQQRKETLSFLLMCWGALAFVGVFCVVIFLLMNGAQRGSGGI